MKKLKRLFSVTVAIALIMLSLSTLPVAAASSDFTVVDGVLTAYTGTDTDVVIPGDLGITKIGYTAFNGQAGLFSITIPSGVTTIGYAAFEWCNNLNSVTIPDSVTDVGEWAFYGTDIPTPILIDYGKILCYVPTSFSSYTIPDTVTTISPYAFYMCKDLIFLTIPIGVTTIGPCAFEGTSISTPIISNDKKTLCYVPSSITSFTIPDSVTTIQDYAFEGCRDITSLVIPDGVTEIGAGAFGYCVGLTTLKIPSSVNKIGSYAFVGTNISTPILTNDKKTLCYVPAGFTSYKIPEGVTTIDGAFLGCTSLTSVTFPNSLKSIGNNAFAVCNSLKSIVIPSGVTDIGICAFASCGNLTSITIPSSVVSIGYMAFDGCDKLTIYTTTSSFAQQYAESNNIKFAKIEKKDVTAPSKPKVNSVFSKYKVVTGTTEAGAVVTVKVGSKKLGSATANSAGKFKVTIKAQKAGTVLSVTATDKAKNVSKVTKVKVKK